MVAQRARSTYMTETTGKKDRIADAARRALAEAEARADQPVELNRV